MHVCVCLCLYTSVYVYVCVCARVYICVNVEEILDVPTTDLAIPLGCSQLMLMVTKWTKEAGFPWLCFEQWSLSLSRAEGIIHTLASAGTPPLLLLILYELWHIPALCYSGACFDIWVREYEPWLEDCSEIPNTSDELQGWTISIRLWRHWESFKGWMKCTVIMGWIQRQMQDFS